MSTELSEPSGPDPERTGPVQHWLQVTVQAPPEVGRAVLALLQERFGFRDIAPIDWCALERYEDFSHASYAPCEPVTENPYVVDWRQGEGVGDVVVNITRDTPSS